MKLTKYQHACFTIEIDGNLLVVDPGVLTRDYTPSDNVIAVIVTHEHPDHVSPDLIAQIYEKNPDTLLISTESVIGTYPDYRSLVAVPGQHTSVGPFHLDFYGGSHAKIYGDIPAIDNVAVMINDTLYYPGDSFDIPEVAVINLAVPLGAPWLKSSESIDFLRAVNPQFAFPTHYGTLSSDGIGFANAWLQRFADEQSIEYRDISGHTIEL